MKYIAVIGSRGFNDYSLFVENLEYYIQNIKENITFVSGGANGTDSLVKRYCTENNLPLIEFLPDYEKYSGKVAPIKRNDQIVEKSDMLIAFWDGVSRGSDYTIKLAAKKGLLIRIVRI